MLTRHLPEFDARDAAVPLASRTPRSGAASFANLWRAGITAHTPHNTTLMQNPTTALATFATHMAREQRCAENNGVQRQVHSALQQTPMLPCVLNHTPVPRVYMHRVPAETYLLAINAPPPSLMTSASSVSASSTNGVRGSDRDCMRNGQSAAIEGSTLGLCGCTGL